MINRKASKNGSKQRIRELKARLLELDRSYYNNSISLVSDAEYDLLKDEYNELCPDDLWIGAPVPEVSEWTKASHNIPMHSLNKVKVCNFVGIFT